MKVKGRITAPHGFKRRVLEKAKPQLADMAKNAMRNVMRKHTTNPQILEAMEDDIVVTVTQKGTLTVRTEGLAELFDSGWDHFDMKPGMLRSPRAKQGRDGKFIDVPLKFKAGSPLAQMVEQIQKNVKSGTIRSHYDPDEFGEERFGEPVVKRLYSTGRKGRRGAFRRIAMHRSMSAYTGGSLDKRQVFRRISERSHPHAWINRGRPRINLAGAVLKQLQREIRRIGREERKKR